MEVYSVAAYLPMVSIMPGTAGRMNVGLKTALRKSAIQDRVAH